MTTSTSHLLHMQQALTLAEKAAALGEVPVGAVLVHDDNVIGEGWNCPISTHDPSAHAEIQAIRAATNTLQNYRLPGATLYVTLEPCLMCVGAILQARIKTVFFGAHDPKVGAIESVVTGLQTKGLNHQVNWEGGLLAKTCSELLRNFFLKKR